MLSSKSAIVTDPTSGTGLIIAQALAGSIVMPAAYAVFLYSDHTQSITATTLPVDGGWTAH
jgi:NAD(P)-dependent dehydrogenase (short-subunit alcohol dehydrogenase family)